MWKRWGIAVTTDITVFGPRGQRCWAACVQSRMIPHPIPIGSWLRNTWQIFSWIRCFPFHIFCDEFFVYFIGKALSTSSTKLPIVTPTDIHTTFQPLRTLYPWAFVNVLPSAKGALSHHHPATHCTGSVQAPGSPGCFTNTCNFTLHLYLIPPTRHYIWVCGLQLQLWVEILDCLGVWPQTTHSNALCLHLLTLRMGTLICLPHRVAWRVNASMHLKCLE